MTRPRFWAELSGMKEPLARPPGKSGNRHGASAHNVTVHWVSGQQKAAVPSRRQAISDRRWDETSGCPGIRREPLHDLAAETD